MAKTRTLILNRRQTGTLISPARLEIVEALSALGPTSAHDLAVAAGAARGGDRQALQTLSAVLRQAGRDVEAAFTRGPALLRGRFHGAQQLSGALTPPEVKRVIRLLEQIEPRCRHAPRCLRARRRHLSMDERVRAARAEAPMTLLDHLFALILLVGFPVWSARNSAAWNIARLARRIAADPKARTNVYLLDDRD